MDQERPEPTGCRRRGPAPASSFPRGAALVTELWAIAARHALSEADKAYIIAHVAGWRRAILGSLGPAPTGDAAAADAPPGDPIGKVL